MPKRGILATDLKNYGPVVKVILVVDKSFQTLLAKDHVLRKMDSGQECVSPADAVIAVEVTVEFSHPKITEPYPTGPVRLVKK